MKSIETPHLDILLKPISGIWEYTFDSSPSVNFLFDRFPSVMAIDLILHNNKSNKNNKKFLNSPLVGSPNAWIMEQNELVSMEDILTPPGLVDSIWRIGRELGFNKIDPLLPNNQTKTLLYSVIITPNTISIRDAEKSEELAQKSWAGTLETKEKLELISYCDIPEGSLRPRISAQLRQLSKIYTSEFGRYIAPAEPKIEQNNIFDYINQEKDNV